MKVIEDNILGKLTFDDNNIMNAVIELGGQKIDLLIEGDINNDKINKKAISVTKDFISDFDRLDKEMRAFAAEELTENANDWLADSLEEGETAEEITEESFADRMVPECLSVFGIAENDIGYDMYYGDNDMFWGHTIIVSGTPEDGIESADICG